MLAAQLQLPPDDGARFQHGGDVRLRGDDEDVPSFVDRGVERLSADEAGGFCR